MITEIKQDKAIVLSTNKEDEPTFWLNYDEWLLMQERKENKEREVCRIIPFINRMTEDINKANIEVKEDTTLLEVIVEGRPVWVTLEYWENLTEKHKDNWFDLLPDRIMSG